MQAYWRTVKIFNEAGGKICRKDVRAGLCEQALKNSAPFGALCFFIWSLSAAGPNHTPNFSQKRCMMAANWARVAVPLGIRLFPLPLIIPLPTAQAMASRA